MRLSNLFVRGLRHLLRPAERTRTVEVDPRAVRRLTVVYGPRADGHPDGGEIVWAWVPFAEGDGRGKDRPVLVLAPHARDRVYAVKLTSKEPPRAGSHVPLGAGGWDPQCRASWAAVDRLYTVHVAGVRREGAAVAGSAFARVAEELHRRYGWCWRPPRR